MHCSACIGGLMRKSALQDLFFHICKVQVQGRNIIGGGGLDTITKTQLDSLIHKASKFKGEEIVCMLKVPICHFMFGEVTHPIVAFVHQV